MKEHKSRKRRLMDIAMRYIMMIIGAAIYTYGLDVFLVPNHLIDGGVVGIALMASKLSDISFSILVMLINLPFLYVGYMQIGKSFTISTLFAIACISVFSAFMHHIPPLVHDPLLAAVFGGIILGLGVGIIIRNGGSLDGSEIVAIIFDKKSSFSVGEIVMFLNFFMYSLIAYFVAYKMMDLVITGVEESKGVMVITDKSEEVADVVMHRLGRGVTLLYGEGAYTKTPKRIIYCVVTRLEMTKLKDIIYEVDENAFITINDVHDVFGGQFGKKSIH